jgi:putative peptidoglycan lipid II flippase
LNLFRSAALISLLTLLSRITGLIRETLIAAVFGAGALTDAFFVAFRLPNMLRRMFAEGAFSQAFVPLLAESRQNAENGDGAAKLLVDRVTTALFWAVLLISAIGVLAAPALVWAVAGGLRANPAGYDAAVVMTRWMFPYILLVSMFALSAGILNTWQRFALPAFTPVLLNLAIIAAALFLAPHFDPPIYALAAGVMLGGVAQLLIQVPALWRIGMLPRISWQVGEAFADPGTRRVLKLMAPAVLAVSAQQISLLINTHIASRLESGSVSWVSFGDRLMEFPTALVAVALGTVLLPGLSAAVAADDRRNYSTLLDWGLRLVLIMSLPAAVGLFVLAEPLTALLYHYGKFTAYDVEMTARTVRLWAIGLVGLSTVKILAPGFFAHQNVKTPVKIAVLAMVVTQLLNIVFVPWFAHAGLALSISVAAMLNAGLLGAGLLRSNLYQPAPGWGRFAGKVLVASVLLALALLWIEPRFDWIALQATPWQRIGLVLGLVAGGAVLYAVALFSLGLRPTDLLKRPAARSE